MSEINKRTTAKSLVKKMQEDAIEFGYKVLTDKTGESIQIMGVSVDHVGNVYTIEIRIDHEESNIVGERKVWWCKVFVNGVQKLSGTVGTHFSQFASIDVINGCLCWEHNIVIVKNEKVESQLSLEYHIPMGREYVSFPIAVREPFTVSEIYDQCHKAARQTFDKRGFGQWCVKYEKTFGTPNFGK